MLFLSMLLFKIMKSFNLCPLTVSILFHATVSQVSAVDKTTGLIKVSRKALLDPKEAVPDTIHTVGSTVDETVDAADDLGGELPTFPITPPKKFDLNFFR